MLEINLLESEERGALLSSTIHSQQPQQLIMQFLLCPGVRSVIARDRATAAVQKFKLNEEKSSFIPPAEGEEK